MQLACRTRPNTFGFWLGRRFCYRPTSDSTSAPRPPGRRSLAPTGPAKENSHPSIFLSRLHLGHRKPVPYLRQYARPCRISTQALESVIRQEGDDKHSEPGGPASSLSSRGGMTWRQPLRAAANAYPLECGRICTLGKSAGVRLMTIAG